MERNPLIELRISSVQMGIIYLLQKIQGTYDDERTRWVLTFYHQTWAIEISFLENCIGVNEYRKRFWKALRGNYNYLNAKTLKRHTLNCICVIKSRLVEQERNKSLGNHPSYNLSLDEDKQFEDYSLIVTGKQTHRLDSSIWKQWASEKYVFNHSSFSL